MQYFQHSVVAVVNLVNLLNAIVHSESALSVMGEI